MGSLLVSTVGLIPVICALYLLYKLLRFGSRDKRLPPGPPTIPILGNAHLMPTHHFEKKLKEWSDQYGGIFSLKIGAGTIIVLNDRRAVHDLIDKRSAIYSGRPFDHNVEVAMGSENFAFLQASNPLWRSARKIASQFLSPKSLDDKIMPIQEAETSQLIYDLLETPDQFFTHLKRVTSSVASIVIFGHRAPTFSDFWGSCVYRAMDAINPTLEPGTYLPIEQFPILKLIPDWMAPSKNRAKQCYKTVTAVWMEAQQRVEERRRSGDERVSLCDRILSDALKTDTPFSRSELCNTYGSLHQGAADTTSSMLLSGILYLAKNPWVQEKAREELDRVCGTDRMPTWNDFNDLPYVNCIVKEGLRIRPVAPPGVPHRVTRDDWFDGYLIPKDSTIFFSAYGLHYSLYDDPTTYNPDRFLNHPRLAMDYAGSPDYENRDHYAYGSGRRICVGIHLAERTQWRILARLLWAFSIEPDVDEKGNRMDLDTSDEAWEDGFLICPKPYKVKFVPRSEKHEHIIRKDYENAREYLKQWE